MFCPLFSQATRSPTLSPFSDSPSFNPYSARTQKVFFWTGATTTQPPTHSHANYVVRDTLRLRKTQQPTQRQLTPARGRSKNQAKQGSHTVKYARPDAGPLWPCAVRAVRCARAFDTKFELFVWHFRFWRKYPVHPPVLAITLYSNIFPSTLISSQAIGANLYLASRRPWSRVNSYTVQTR